jgi:hypothetical protein
MTQPGPIPSDERIVAAMIQLACATRPHRMIVAGPHGPEVLLELQRRDYLNRKALRRSVRPVRCGARRLAGTLDRSSRNDP